jgi:hypothetical protein
MLAGVGCMLLVVVPATDRIRILLETLDDARAAWHSGSGGGGVIQMPSMYHLGSYRELESQMQRIRDNPHSRALWQQLCLRYRWGSLRWVTVQVERRDRNPIYRIPPRSELRLAGEHSASKARVMVYEWSEEVDAQQVKQGLELLKRIMFKGRYERIMLPPDVGQQPMRAIHSLA